MFYVFIWLNCPFDQHDLAVMIKGPACPHRCWLDLRISGEYSSVIQWEDRKHFNMYQMAKFHLAASDSGSYCSACGLRATSSVQYHEGIDYPVHRNCTLCTHPNSPEMMTWHQLLQWKQLSRFLWVFWVFKLSFWPGKYIFRLNLWANF